MLPQLTLHWRWTLASLVLAWVMALGIVRIDLSRQRELFETDARIAHRLLSQRAVQHDAILATLALLQTADASAPERRLTALYPQVLQVLRRDGAARWPDPALQAAESQSRRERRAVLAQSELAQGRFTLLQAADPSSFALHLEVAAMVPWADWPMARDGPVRVVLDHAGQHVVLQAGAPGSDALFAGWLTFNFSKHLAADSQPFDLRLSRSLSWQALPWLLVLGAWVMLGAAMAVLFAWQHQRAARRRAEELLRLGQVGRLNALGELAAGMAHELNQPLTAILANTQAAQRLLDDDPPDLALARQAMARSVAQARRAADVVQRLRRLVQRTGEGTPSPPLVLADAVKHVLDLLSPECKRLGVQTQLHETTPGLLVQAEPVALEQIVHNLVQNALQALQTSTNGPRAMDLRIDVDLDVDTIGRVVLRVRDNGSGLSPEALQRAFEPFFTTRDEGLGLGLSLCETLAVGMGGSLAARNQPSGGAEFTLTLPRSGAEPTAPTAARPITRPLS